MVNLDPGRDEWLVDSLDGNTGAVHVAPGGVNASETPAPEFVQGREYVVHSTVTSQMIACD